ncbi:hypothetical protein EVG20_g7718 [Dentipellis fragilis]|uniref:Uncharacterized protein n=1 Tax=Dentipellis fragilis TaxID=205917 RepID=A0A4Y9YD40_9AGAM|nr:hypothetical protein EVG20_g7718 [Dentipellis fragilis]
MGARKAPDDHTLTSHALSFCGLRGERAENEPAAADGMGTQDCLADCLKFVNFQRIEIIERSHEQDALHTITERHVSLRAGGSGQIAGNMTSGAPGERRRKECSSIIASESGVLAKYAAEDGDRQKVEGRVLR